MDEFIPPPKPAAGAEPNPLVDGAWPKPPVTTLGDDPNPLLGAAGGEPPKPPPNGVLVAAGAPNAGAPKPPAGGWLGVADPNGCCAGGWPNPPPPKPDIVFSESGLLDVMCCKGTPTPIK